MPSDAANFDDNKLNAQYKHIYNALSALNEENLKKGTSPKTAISIKLKTFPFGIPYWHTKHIDSIYDKDSANYPQSMFCNLLKRRFLNGDFYSVENSTNYSFILLHDLLNDFETHNNIQALEEQLVVIAECYPHVKSDAIRLLIEKTENIGDESRLKRLKKDYKNQYDLVKTYNGPVDLKIGGKYKSRLGLTNEQARWVDKVSSWRNEFCDMEFCKQESLKFYVKTMEALKIKFAQENLSIDVKIRKFVELINKKYSIMSTYNYDYKNNFEIAVNSSYSRIFDTCENTVRQSYKYKLKPNKQVYISKPEIFSEFDKHILPNEDSILLQFLPTISPIDRKLDIEFNRLNLNRWKPFFEDLTKIFEADKNGETFSESIRDLAALNVKNREVSKIYYEAAKLVAAENKEMSLSFYIYYILNEPLSANSLHKKIPAATQKILFANKEQVQKFEVIVTSFIKNKNLENAIEAINEFYFIKRKKVKIDSAGITKVQEDHSGTIELLNEYLNDESDSKNTMLSVSNDKQTNKNFVGFENLRSLGETAITGGFTNVNLTPIQVELLVLFSKNKYALSFQEIDTFAKFYGVLKNQLIEGINEVCFEINDDILIEEEDNRYTISEQYFKKLLIKY